VACWAKNLQKIPILALYSALFYYRSYFFTTGTIKYSFVQCEISATTLRIHGKTNIFKILKLKSVLVFITLPHSNYMISPFIAVQNMSTVPYLPKKTFSLFQFYFIYMVRIRILNFVYSTTPVLAKVLNPCGS
jgi:hypothetical protein